MNTIHYKDSAGTTQSYQLQNNGIFLAKGTYETLLTPVSMKDYIINSSRIENGSRVTIYNKKTEQRDITISFFIDGSSVSQYQTRYNTFLSILQSGQIALECSKISNLLGSTTYYKLVYRECSKYGDYGLKRGKFTVKFTEYNPSDRSSNI